MSFLAYLGGGSGGIDVFGLGVPGVVDGVGVLKLGDGKLNSSYLLGRNEPGVVTKLLDPDGEGEPAVELRSILPE